MDISISGTNTCFTASLHDVTNFKFLFIKFRLWIAVSKVKVRKYANNDDCTVMILCCVIVTLDDDINDGDDLDNDDGDDDDASVYVKSVPD